MRKSNRLKSNRIHLFLILFFNCAPLFVPAQTPREREVAKPSPTPTPFVAATDTAQNLSKLQSQIRLAQSNPALQRGQIAVKIAALDSGKTIFEQNAEKYLMPASNMKSFTVATALERLTPSFHFVTSVFADAKPDANGVIKGDLRIYGRGDVSISTAFYNGDYYAGLDALADRVAQSGVRRVEGNLVGDENYFTGKAIPYGWEWDDLQWYFGAEISAFSVNDNAVDLSVKPGSLNSPCVVQIQPFNAIYKIVNSCVTVAANSPRTLTITKKLEQNILEIGGTMPIGDKGFANPVTVSHPADLFLALLRERLAKKGIVVVGRTRTFSLPDKRILAVESSIAPVEIAKLESPPLSLIAAKTLKPSQNMYTETILWTLGEEIERRKSAATNANTPSAELGLKTIRDFLRQIGIADDGIMQYDGSGLSRHNLITASAAVQLYTYMAKRSPYKDVWMSALPIGGVDGTLSRRFAGTSGANNVRAKTGTIDQVSALSGYVTSKAGEKFVFSVIVNGVADVSVRQSVIDQIVLQLANFSEKIQ